MVDKNEFMADNGELKVDDGCLGANSVVDNV